MRVAYILLILSIVAVCIWFVYVSTDTKAFYRKVFKIFLWSVAFMYVIRLYGVALEEGFISGGDLQISIERSLHYAATVSIYSLYAYFIFYLIGLFRYYPLKVKLLFWIPDILIVLFIMTSPITKLAFYVEDGVVYHTGLFGIIPFVRAVYAIGATVYALKKSHLMIKIFGHALNVMFVFAVIQVVFYAISKDETLYYTTMVVNVVIFVLTVIMLDFYKDGPTNLFNKKAFTQYVVKNIDKNKHKKVYLIKLKNYDYIKENTDEESLNEMIKELAECIREYTMLASTYYLGSGKFSIIVHKRDKFDEDVFLEKIKKRFCIPFELNEASIQLSLFIVVMNVEKGKINKKNFLKYFSACDEMRYHSNELIEIVQSDKFGMDKLERYHSVEEAIDRALIEKEFQMYYQPIVSTHTGKIVSAEALIRLKDRELGFISPEEFIPISESNGKIIEVSEFVIDSVFRFVRDNDLKALGMEFVEMNLSVMQCMDKNLTSKLSYYIQKYNVDPRCINLEITETATNFDENRLREQLENVKKLGFSFSLDDYGTGYSNLVRVLEYPVEVIKLDKSIVWSAFNDQDSFVTIKNLIGMFHDVRRKLVAEGVENEEQMHSLKELGCDYLQGYYYSKPVPENEFLTFVRTFNNK